MGAFVGTKLAGQVMAQHKLAVAMGAIEHNWRQIWMLPALGATAVLIVFLIFFQEPKRAEPEPASP